jgi:hypothetical protein
MLTSRILAASLFFALITAAQAQQPKAAEPAPQPALELNEIPESELDRYIAKSNTIVALLNTSQRAEQSLNRYASWVNLKTGPTGKERIIYGLYSVGVSSARTAINKTRQSLFNPPALPALDTATQALIDAFEALVPILNEAEAYYDRKDYLTDNMAGGKELHGRIVPAGNAFLAARRTTSALQNELKDAIDVAQLARIERIEGKSVRWHGINTMTLAKKAVDLLPGSPKVSSEQLKSFDAALALYGDAVRDFDNAVRESGKSPPGASSPRDILGRMRELRSTIGKSRTDNMTFSMQRSGIITSYNMMVRMTNVFR